MSGAGIVVVDAPAAARYEAHVDDGLAGVAEYRLLPGAVDFLHTRVCPGFEGRGVGGRLAQEVLDDVRARGLRAVPHCPFIAGWIVRHPAYRDLVAQEHLALLQRDASAP